MAGLDLRDLKPAAEPVVLRDGTEHRVAIMNAPMAQLYAKLGDEELTQADQFPVMWELVGLLLPSATKAQVEDLDLLEVRAIIEYATQSIRAVFASEKNGDRPEDEAVAASGPTTVSAPSSSPSPGEPAGVSAT